MFFVGSLREFTTCCLHAILSIKRLRIQKIIIDSTFLVPSEISQHVFLVPSEISQHVRLLVEGFIRLFEYSIFKPPMACKPIGNLTIYKCLENVVTLLLGINLPNFSHVSIIHQRSRRLYSDFRFKNFKLQTTHKPIKYLWKISMYLIHVYTYNEL